MGRDKERVSEGQEMNRNLQLGRRHLQDMPETWEGRGSLESMGTTIGTTVGVWNLKSLPPVARQESW